MYKNLITGIIFLLLSNSGIAANVQETGFTGRPLINNIWGPTGYTLNRNEFVLGLGSIGFALNENVQIGTNVLLFMFQIYNGRH